MSNDFSSFLRLHVEEGEQEQAASVESCGFDLNSLMQAFSKATGWVAKPRGGTPHHPAAVEDETLPLGKRLQLVASAPMDGALGATSSPAFECEHSAAWELMEQLDHLIQELKRADEVIARQEAQLATAIGVNVRPDEAEMLGARMQESLERAARQTASDAGAIYLLDESTSELKMRSCWGLASNALKQPARELRGSLADLEALMGNAVLIENTQLAPEWNCPENFAAALCLPIGSPTMPQGTMWLWSDHIRDFNSSHIEIARSACDKILVDIERSILADEVLKSRSDRRELSSAGLVQASRLPSLQPLHQDYEVGGWTYQGGSVGGNFHTWTMNKHGQICAALGAASTRGPSGALIAGSVQTVVETCWNANHRPSQVLRKANDLLWNTEDGDWRSSLGYVQLHPPSGSVQISVTGSIQAFLVGERGFRMFSSTPTMLAAQPDTAFRNEQIVLQGGEVLVLASADVVGGPENGGFTQDQFLNLMRQFVDDHVPDVAEHLARLLPIGPSSESQTDRSLLVIRRKF